MKRYIRLFILLFLFLFTLTCSSADSKAASLKIKYNNITKNYKGRQVSCTNDGRNIKLNSTKGIVINGTVMMSYKDVVKSGLGISCRLNSKKRRLTITGNGKSIILTTGSKKATVNGKKYTLKQAPVKVRYIKKKSTKLLIPLKFVVTKLGYTYNYNKASSKVSLTSPFVIKYNSQWNIYKKYKGTAVYNDVTINTDSMPLFSINNCTMGPVKKIFQDTLGISYSYTKETGEIVLQSTEHKIVMNINSTTAILDDNIGIELPSKPLSVKRKDTGYSCIMAPLAALIEAFNYNYKWDSSTNTATIYKVNYCSFTAKDTTYNTEKYTNALCSLNTIYDTASSNLIVTLSMINDINPDTVIFTQNDVSKDITLLISQSTNLIPDNSANIGNFNLDSITSTVNADTFTTVLFKYNNSINYYYAISGKELKIFFTHSDKDGYSVKVNLPDTVSFNSVTTDDMYYSKYFVLHIPGNNTAFYSANNINIISELISNYSVSYNQSTDTTDIRFNTTSADILAYRLFDEKKTIGIKLGTPKELYDKIIVLDAGHGGKDSGATSNKTKESDINLAVIYTCARKYFNSAGTTVKAYWTRTDDTFLTLADRAGFAAKVNADLFISMHMNSATSISAKGTEIYYSNNNNKSNAWGLNSYKFATKLIDAIIPAIGSNTRGIKSANYYVINHNTVPAVLIELGFITNSTDYSIITDVSKQDAAAKAIYDTVAALITK